MYHGKLRPLPNLLDALNDPVEVEKEKEEVNIAENNNIAKNKKSQSQKRQEKIAKLTKENEELWLENQKLKVDMKTLVDTLVEDRTSIDKLEKLLKNSEIQGNRLNQELLELEEKFEKAVVLTKELEATDCVFCLTEIPKCEHCNRRYHKECIADCLKLHKPECPICEKPFKMETSTGIVE